MPNATAIHEAFHARLVTFLARLSRRRDVAEDLVEETWLRLVRQAVRLRPDTRLGPWLFTVARNLYVSHCRSRLLEESHAADLFGLWPGGAPRSSPFEETAATEFERRLEAALASLPASSREVLLLVAVEGLRPAEAAEVCGITPGALRQRLSRARANDPLLRALARLPDAAPDEARASRVRERRHAALERTRLRSAGPARPSTTARAIEAALVGGLCLLYLSTVLLEAGRLLVR